MEDFYTSYRALYQVLFGKDGTHNLQARIDLEDKIPALRRTETKVGALIARLEHEQSALRQSGQDVRSLSRELRRLRFVAGAISDLLSEVDDNDAAIRAAKAEIDGANEKLSEMTEAAGRLAEDLGAVSTVIDTVAKIVKLIE
ncbi:MAG TPA: hypothetical protein VF695_11495 [Sphingomonas sp.]